MTHAIRSLIIAAVSLLLGGCITVTVKQHRGSSGTVTMTTAEATAALQAWNVWLNAHQGRHLAPEVQDGQRWTIDKNGITEHGVREVVAVAPQSPGGEYWTTKKAYTATVLFSNANEILHGGYYIRVNIYEGSGMQRCRMHSVAIPTPDMSSKRLVSALLTVCSNVQ